MTRLGEGYGAERGNRKILINDYCPSDFGVDDRLEMYCNSPTRDCEACWNEEVKK